MLGNLNDYLSKKNDTKYIVKSIDGLIDIDNLKNTIREDTTLISIMHVNNEIGVIQPIAEIGSIVAEARKSKQAPKVVFHCDAVQAVGRVPVDVKACGIDH